MTEEVEKKLRKKYKSILGEVSIDCADGWADIISIISDNIKWHNQRIKDANRRKKAANEKPIEYYPCKAIQIKEKFGTLRFYESGGDEFTHGVILTGEAMSSKICEVCGNKGKLRNDNWMRTLCDTHEDERRWRKENESKAVLPNSGQMG